jgi:hypothetical protein
MLHNILELSSMVHTMNFKQATDVLFLDTDHAELAKALGASIAAIRQARLPAGAKAGKKPL